MAYAFRHRIAPVRQQIQTLNTKPQQEHGIIGKAFAQTNSACGNGLHFRQNQRKSSHPLYTNKLACISPQREHACSLPFAHSVSNHGKLRVTRERKATTQPL
ncbi:hypothetical protein HBI70_131520 [Parastagonospora nodorum]|nr:hypothetical protein HBH52_137810 [Parastagonospora nodorum]KAH4222754.1 hypothetical protein HBI06_138520 [Parastagonospora nodorum]KAH4240596.1 hypothetical protein HBI05_110220 [Parastagonospora nodorum]KAH4930891.1 hypothetical protein HBH73_190050 [Parastagonospora nodorum]KAH4943855.1 hypothetical protein HBH74_059240 [Parastagonospora nodorum]